MIKHAFRLALLALVGVLCSCEKADTTGRELTILSEVMKPYNYEENGQQKGITIEVIRYILQELDLTNPIQISNDWDAIFERLKTEDNIAAVTTALTPERKANFKWVGPVTLWNVGFVALPSSGITINSAEEAKHLGPVGIVKSYFTGEILRDLGFTSLVEFGDLEELVEALFDGSVKVIFDNMSLLQIIVQENPGYAEGLANLLTYSTTQGYIAFSANVSDRLVANWQKKLDKMKDSGLLQAVFDDYLPGTRAPGRVTIFTELNPPQSYLNREGALTGSAAEMIRAMMEEMEIDYPVECTHWNNAFDQIKLVPNSLAFPTLLTLDREKSFKWIGPVCKKNYVFVISASSSYQIARIDDARTLPSVATMTGWGS
ncbi:MAG: transporter substrate-binding domain-containing protein, partial [Bacteroidales bacterium]